MISWNITSMSKNLSEKNKKAKAKKTVSQAAKDWRLEYCAFELGLPKGKVEKMRIKVGTKGEKDTCAWHISEKRKLISRVFERMSLEELRRIVEELGYA